MGGRRLLSRESASRDPASSTAGAGYCACVGERRNIEAIQQGIDAFNRRDFDGALAALHDDVTWERFLSRSETDDPFVRGKEELRATWESQVESVDLRLEPKEFIAAGDHKVIVPSLMVARGSGSKILLSAPVTWVWTIDEHGLASKVEAFENRADALRAAGAPRRD